ncbi:hypothetical protein HFN63_33070 [Rhizobium leguminosarum]|uniref:hypothetical protein n=1 Tax=Rhizobium leguminosarum TaxID=384 RepID=UPI001C93B212|nr:hypothetical protein [Rhizobium leguminosarum]MBY5774863.1 hypothetical protein [Rhizobium leguminosarum]
MTEIAPPSTDELGASKETGSKYVPWRCVAPHFSLADLQITKMLSIMAASTKAGLSESDARIGLPGKIALRSVAVC